MLGFSDPARVLDECSDVRRRQHAKVVVGEQGLNGEHRMALRIETTSHGFEVERIGADDSSVCIAHLRERMGGGYDAEIVAEERA